MIIVNDYYIIAPMYVQVHLYTLRTITVYCIALLYVFAVTTQSSPSVCMHNKFSLPPIFFFFEEFETKKKIILLATQLIT